MLKAQNSKPQSLNILLVGNNMYDTYHTTNFLFRHVDNVFLLMCIRLHCNAWNEQYFNTKKNQSIMVIKIQHVKCTLIEKRA